MSESVAMRDWAKARGIDPALVLQELETIREENDGKLTPEAVVSTAADKEHTLHGLFEWDNRKAGAQYRLHQARNLIRSVQVIRPEGKRPAYVNVRVEKERYYKPPEIVVNNEAEYRSAVRILQSHIIATQRSLDHLRELAGQIGDADRNARLTVAYEAVMAARSALELIQ